MQNHTPFFSAIISEEKIIHWIIYYIFNFLQENASLEIFAKYIIIHKTQLKYSTIFSHVQHAPFPQK